jgi:HEPN/Toprim N-terminal domain 1
MGSIITLNIGNLQVDWAKNWRGADHSVLFQSSDLKRIPYHYVTDNHEPVVETKEAFSNPLRKVVARLELLGFTLETARGHFVEAMADHGLYLEDSGSAFDLFCDCLCHVNLTATSPDYNPAYDFGEVFGRMIFEA